MKIKILETTQVQLIAENEAEIAIIRYWSRQGGMASVWMNEQSLTPELPKEVSMFINVNPPNMAEQNKTN